MAEATLDKSTFSSGELDAALHARIDLAKTQAGLKICENFAVMVEGGITRTPGTQFVTAVRNHARPAKLLPFEFSVDDAYQLLFNDGYMRVLRNGGVVEFLPGAIYELPVPFTDAELSTLRWAQSADVIFIAGAGRPRVLTRQGHAAWTIAEYENLRGPIEPQNTDPARTITASGQTGTVSLTANTPTFLAGHVGSIWRLDEANIANVPRWIGNEKPVAIGDLRRNAGIVYSVVEGDDAGPNSPVHEEGDISSGEGKVTWRYEHSGYAYVKITAVSSPTSAQVTVIGKLPSDVTGGNATYRWYEAAWSDERGWPAQVLLHDNRLIWARGNKLWGTKLNDFYDFAVSAEDDSGIATALTSQDGKLVDIQWMLNSGVVVLGTRAGEWMVRGSDPFEAITLANIRAIPDGTEGSAPHRPQAVDGGAVFIGRSKRRLHFAQFDRISEKIEVGELTLYARNILRGGAVTIAYQRDPHRIVWIVQDNGELVGITFRPDQDVQGWHRHPMINGHVEDVGVITSPDASVSQLWVIVRRTVQGEVRRYVEVMQPFFQPVDLTAPTAAGAWFVQSGLRYVGAPATLISGLTHLIGQDVAVFADGIEHRRLIVSATGTVTLDRAASNVVVGLPMKARARTLRYETQVDGGTTKGAQKRADSVLIERLHAAGGHVFCNDRAPGEALLLTGQRVLSQPQPLVTDAKSILTLCTHDPALEVEIVCDNTYPFTLLGVAPHVQFTEGR